MLYIVSVFLTPKENEPSEAQLKVEPENALLFIDTDEHGQLLDIDEVLWQYVQQPPPEVNALPFPDAPEPQNVYVEVRFAPSRTPFPQPATDSMMALMEGDSAGYTNLGINPIIPNQPRLDAAPEPPLEFTSSAAQTPGPPRSYKYAVILTSPNEVLTLDPRLIIIRRRIRQGL